MKKIFVICIIALTFCNIWNVLQVYDFAYWGTNVNGGATMINIILDITLIDSMGWDYPLEEIPYLIETHTGETFVFHNNRLYETITN